MRERIQQMLARLFGKPSTSRLTFEQKLELLARCGLKLEPPFTIQDLLGSWKRENLEKPGFDLALVCLGMTEEKSPWRNHCVNVWHFDTECIEDNGSYCRIAERMKEMAQGSLPIENIRDHVDLVGGSAWLSYDFRGQNVRVDCKVDNDWVDIGLFAHFIELLGKSDPSKIYLYYDIHGQDCVLACVTRAEFAELKRAGVAFVPMH